MSELYKRIKIRREELGLSQDELAKKIGYKSRSTIAKIESGENDIPQAKIKAFADALDTTPSELMGWGDKLLEKNCDTCKNYNTYFDCSQCNDFDEWEKAEEKEDLVNHPKHYTQGKYEVIDIIMEAVKDLPPEQAVCVGHIIRYIMRYKYKNGLQDVKKCKWYTDKLINLMEGK